MSEPVQAGERRETKDEGEKSPKRARVEEESSSAAKPGVFVQARPIQPKSKEELLASAPLAARDPALEELLLYFGRTPVTQIAPRPTTGTVRVFKQSDVVCVHRSERTARVFTKLVTEGFLAAPVLDALHKFTGFIDMLDLVIFTVDIFAKHGGDPNTPEGWAKFCDSISAWRDSTIEDVIAHVESSGHPRKSTPFPLQRSFTVLQAMAQFAALGTQRLAVLDDENRVAGILTQSMVLSLLDQNINKIGRYRQTQVQEMHSLLQPVLSVKEDEKAINAFRLMADRGVSGLAVVDAQGFLVDNISVRDLRGIGQKPTDFSNLFQTVKVFKQRERSLFPQQVPGKPLQCEPTSTLEQVIKLMDDGNMHRVFEVQKGDEEGKLKPLHVISQTDLIRYFALKMGVWTPTPIRYSQSSGESDSASDIASVAENLK